MSSGRRKAFEASKARNEEAKDKQGKTTASVKEVKQNALNKPKHDINELKCEDCIKYGLSSHNHKQMLEYKNDLKNLQQDMKIFHDNVANFDSNLTQETQNIIDTDQLQSKQGKKCHELLCELKSNILDVIKGVNVYLQDKGDRASKAKPNKPKAKSNEQVKCNVTRSESPHLLDDLRLAIKELQGKCDLLEGGLVLKSGVYNINVYHMESVNLTEDMCSQCSGVRKEKQCLKEENDQLKTKAKESEMKKQDLDEKIKQHERANENLKEKLEKDKADSKKCLDDYASRKSELEKQINELKLENNNLKAKLEKERNEMKKIRTQTGIPVTLSEHFTITEMQSKIESLTKRLGQEMSSKIGNDESSLENISIKNRPMNVANEYSLLCSNAWLDAKLELDKKNKSNGKPKEEENIDVLRKILVESSKQASITAQEVWNCVTNPLGVVLAVRKSSKILQDMTKAGQSKKDDLQFPLELENKISDKLRQRADMQDVEFILKEISKDNDIAKALKTHKKYGEECARLGWKMALQRPQMTFKVPNKGDKWNSNEIEPFWGSDVNAKGAKIKYIVHPILMHNTSVMTKGRALIK